jgi:two-component system nitrogen regulation sensor histidine kinase GlnL
VRVSRDRLELALDSMHVGVVVVDERGRVEFQSAEASRILGISARATLGQPLDALLGAAHPAVTLLREGLEHGREVASNACAIPRRMPGERLVADLSASPIGVGAGAKGAVLVLRDRTIGEELEQLVEQRDQSEQFGRLAAGIAHEVRNPLGGIRGAAQLLLARAEDPALHRYAELIRDETDRVRRLLDDLSQLSEGAPLAPAPTNVHRVLDDLIELQRHAEEWGSIELVREYDPSLPEVRIDADRMTQVFLNLVRNAVQALGGKGRIAVRTRFDSHFQLGHAAGPRAPFVLVEIADDGPGIAEADLPHVFTPFFSRKPGGSGLGLAIARHWTVRHGGHLRVDSRAGEGTRVRVWLPLGRTP